MAVVFEGEGEGLGESAGAAGDQALVAVGGEAAQASHLARSFEGLDGAQQDGGALARRLADEIHAGVDSVTLVGVEPAGGAEHALVAGGGAAV